MMSKNDRQVQLTGMLYPEILDNKEYQVSLGEQNAHIDRDNFTATTLVDGFCECELKTTQELVEFKKPYEVKLSKVLDTNITFGSWSHKTSDKPINHASNVRKQVMYREMFKLPPFQGVKVKKEYLNRAYNLHRHYRASWNIHNKERKKEHDKQQENARYKWKYQSRGRVSQEVKHTELICYDIIHQSVISWLQMEDTPVQQMGQLLSVAHISDAHNAKSFVNALISVLNWCSDDEHDTTEAFVNAEMQLALKVLHKSITGRWTKLEAKTFVDLMRTDAVKYSIDYDNSLSFAYEIVETFTKGFVKLTYTELLRRLLNLMQVLDTITNYQEECLPWNVVGITTLKRGYNKPIKRLGALYQSLCEGNFSKYGKLQPKSLQQAKVQQAMTPQYYQSKGVSDQISDAVNELMKGDKKINERAGRHRWANVSFLQGKLDKDLAGKLKVRKQRPSDVGAVPRYINRWVTDKQVFARKRTTIKGGTVAIDCSGSMSFNASDIEEIVNQLPASHIVGYSGKGQGKKDDRPEGVIETFAKNQRAITSYDNTYICENDYYQNYVDVPAIMWLSRQPKPRMLVSDMEVVAYAVRPDGTDSHTYVHNKELRMYCEELCRKHDIIILKDVDEAKEFAKSLGKR